MTIQRHYEPDPGALDQVVDILYRLLVESPDAEAARGELGVVGESVHGSAGRTNAVLTPE
jgi:hypothetical protein